jgi:polyisoprenoid-binding protein YceI
MRKILIVLTFLFSIPAVVFGQTWKPYDSEISFKIKNAGLTVTGRFTGLKADLVFNPADLGKSTLSASVEVATIKTGIDKRDRDLMEEKYFDADKYKLIEVRSTRLYKKGNQYAGMFNITIKGVTKQVEIPFEFSNNGNDCVFKGSFPLNRRDFGVGGGNMMMSDNLTVSILIKAKT